MTGPISVEQGDYIAVLEDDAARERKARLVLSAQLRSKQRALAAYVERFGDITVPAAGDGENSEEVAGGDRDGTSSR